MSSPKFATDLCLDVNAEIFGFLEPNDQAKLRRTSKYFSTVFNHAFQRGYVAAAIHQGYVDKLDAMHEDGDDGHPLLRVAPVETNALFWPYGKEMHRSNKDKDATLFVNVRLVLGSGKTVLDEKFLYATFFKAVHLYGTETVEMIEDGFLSRAKVQTFTMTTPCPKLREVGDDWLRDCHNLTHFDISGCCALERVGSFWLHNCKRLGSISFRGCRGLKSMSEFCLCKCETLTSVDLSDLVALETVLSCWFDGCRSLEEIDFSPCRSLLRVDSYWMANCPALKTVSLRGCVVLEDVGDGFLYDGSSVERIVVPKNHKLPGHVVLYGFDERVVEE